MSWFEPFGKIYLMQKGEIGRLQIREFVMD